MKKTKFFLSLLLAVVLVVCVIPLAMQTFALDGAGFEAQVNNEAIQCASYNDLIYAKYKPTEQRFAKPAQQNVWTPPIVRLTVAIRGIMDALENTIRTAFNFAGKLFSR